jgi:single-strand DNA-binding protein
VNEPQITLTGNVAAPPSLRQAAGTAVTSFRVGATPRRYDKATDAWSDGETLWFTVTAWRALAEHCASSLLKGDKVVVSGRLTQRTWTADDGSARTGLEVEAASVGIDLSRGNALSIRKPAAPRGEEGREPDEPGLADHGEQWVSTGEVDDDTGAVSLHRVVPDRQEPVGV